MEPSPLSLDEIYALLSPQALLALREVSAREAQSRIEAKQRWAFAKTYLEPVIAAASNDRTAKSFLPNHEFVIRSHALAQLVVKCRKAAHSWGITGYAFAQATQVPKSQINVGSYDENEAKQKREFLDWQYKAVVDANPSLHREWKMNDGAEQRRFSNGSIINFQSRKAPTGAGGHFLGDEFSVEPKGKVTAGEILTAAVGAITHRGNIRLGGTQRGKETLFYKLYSGEYQAELEKNPILAQLLSVLPAWEIGLFPWWESPALCVDVPGATQLAPALPTLDRVLKYGNDKLKFQYGFYLTTPELGEEIFQREFELEVVSDQKKYLSLELLQRCYPHREQPYFFLHTECEGGTFYQDQSCVRPALDIINRLKATIRAGQLRGEFGWAMDIGRHHDLDEIVIGHNLPEDRHALCLRAVITLKNMPFEGKMMVVQYLLTQLPVTRGAIDATRGGIGVQLAEFFEVRYGQRAQGVQFSQTNKQKWATGWKARAENRRLTLPWAPSPDAPDYKDPSHFTKLQSQCLAVKKIESKAGNVLFNVERTKEGHGDAFWASALWNDLYPPVPDATGPQIIVTGRGQNAPIGAGRRPQYGQDLAGRRIIVPAGYDPNARKIIR